MKGNGKYIFFIIAVFIVAAIVIDMLLLAIGDRTEIEQEDIPMSTSLIQGNEEVQINYTTASDGYITITYIGNTTKRIKALVTGPSQTRYQYNLTSGQAEEFPLSDGNGTYTVGIYKNVQDSKYSTVYSSSFSVTLVDEFAPFLHSNQYVNYNDAPKTVAIAKELVTANSSSLEKIKSVYDYVINNMDYDYELAATVKSGYVPDLDAVLASKKGICFDYAALMTGMLRSQGIPCKLVVGYAGSAYHAWISVWSEETGWLEHAIYFDGKSWSRVDPTFDDSTNKGSYNVTYTAKYYY